MQSKKEVNPRTLKTTKKTREELKKEVNDFKWKNSSIAMISLYICDSSLNHNKLVEKLCIGGIDLQFFLSPRRQLVVNMNRTTKTKRIKYVYEPMRYITIDWEVFQLAKQRTICIQFIGIIISRLDTQNISFFLSFVFFVSVYLLAWRF